MVRTDGDALAGVARDFGRIVRGEPAGVARPRSEQEVAGLVRAAGAAGGRLTVRGAGHSFGGQSLPARSVVADMSGLAGACRLRPGPAAGAMIKGGGRHTT